jgi:hypothetical protein
MAAVSFDEHSMAIALDIVRRARMINARYGPGAAGVYVNRMRPVIAALAPALAIRKYDAATDFADVLLALDAAVESANDAEREMIENLRLIRSASAATRYATAASPVMAALGTVGISPTR